MHVGGGWGVALWAGGLWPRGATPLPGMSDPLAGFVSVALLWPQGQLRAALGTTQDPPRGTGPGSCVSPFRCSRLTGQAGENRSPREGLTRKSSVFLEVSRCRSDIACERFLG